MIINSYGDAIGRRLNRIEWKETQKEEKEKEVMKANTSAAAACVYDTYLQASESPNPHTNMHNICDDDDDDEEPRAALLLSDGACDVGGEVHTYNAPETSMLEATRTQPAAISDALPPPTSYSHRIDILSLPNNNSKAKKGRLLCGTLHPASTTHPINIHLFRYALPHHSTGTVAAETAPHLPSHATPNPPPPQHPVFHTLVLLVAVRRLCVCYTTGKLHPHSGLAECFPLGDDGGKQQRCRSGWFLRSLTERAIVPTASSAVSAAAGSSEAEMKKKKQQTTMEKEMERERRICALSDELFSCGNVHLKNVVSMSALPEGLHSFPEICLIGRPNVGKSTLVSCLLHNDRLGRPSSSRGNTQLLKFFNVGDGLALVDTPGYGGWDAGKSRNVHTRATAFAALFRYLALRSRGEGLKRVYWVMEACRSPGMDFTPREEELLCFLRREQISFSVILSKIDRHWGPVLGRLRRVPGNLFQIRKDGTPVLRRSGAVEDARDRLSGTMNLTAALSDIQDAIQQNVKEIFQFLGTDQVPVLGVSANRPRPQESINIDALRYDLTRYCCTDIPDTERLTLNALRSLSYAPPTADALQAVQLAYPLQAFVVPQDDCVSLEEMVRQHEAAKHRFLGGHRGVMVPPSLLPQRGGETVEHALCEGPASCSRTSAQGMVNSRIRTEAEAEAPGLVLANARPDALVQLSHPRAEKNRADEPRGSDVLAWGGQLGIGLPPASSSCCSQPQPPLEGDNQRLFLTTVHHAAASLQRPTDFSTPMGGGWGPRKDAVAINGVRIPWTMIPSSLEALTRRHEGGDVGRTPQRCQEPDTDELAAFAPHSGAGALEALLHAESAGESDPSMRCAFLEHTTAAKVPEVWALEGPAPGEGRHQQRSARRRRMDRLVRRYVDRHRNARSVYVSAEGFMCPWLTEEAGRRRTVIGCDGSVTPAPSGAVMRDLKRVGFGGKSYSAKTLKHRGRATKKTGFWAA
eukprot:gene1497-884_t